MNKINSILSLIISVLLLTGCSTNTLENNENNDINYNIDEIRPIVNYIVNSEKIDETIKNEIEEYVSDDILYIIENNIENKSDLSIINEIYYFDDEVIVQVNEQYNNYIYKLQIYDNKVVNCVIYELYE